MRLPGSHVSIAAVVLVAAVGGTAIWREPATQPEARSGIGSVAPGFSFSDADGATVTLADYRGRVVMLNFWATWCTGCKTELPWLSEFQERYERHGLVSIGAALDDEGWAVVRPFLADHPVAFPVVVADWSMAERYAVTALPLTLLIDRQGRITASHLGIIDRDDWEREIRRALAGDRV